MLEQSEEDKLVKGRLQFNDVPKGEGYFNYWVPIMPEETTTPWNKQGRTIQTPPIPTILQEKIALLNLAGYRVKVPGVGKKQSYLVYYIHMTNKEVQQLESENVKEQTARPGSTTGCGTTAPSESLG